jgi:hypothetical protein
VVKKAFSAESAEDTQRRRIHIREQTLACSATVRSAEMHYEIAILPRFQR